MKQLKDMNEMGSVLEKVTKSISRIKSFTHQRNWIHFLKKNQVGFL